MKFKLISNKCPVCGEKMKFSKKHRMGISLSYNDRKLLIDSRCIRCSVCDTMISSDITYGPIIMILGFFLSLFVGAGINDLAYELFCASTILDIFLPIAWLLFAFLRSACICPQPRNLYRHISIEEATEIWQKKKGEWLKKQKAEREEQNVDPIEAAKNRMFEFKDARRECEICGGRLKIKPFLDGVLPFEDFQFCSKKCEICGTKFFKKPSVAFWIALPISVIHIIAAIASRGIFRAGVIIAASVYFLYNFYANSPFMPYDKGFLDIKALKEKWENKNL